MPPMAVIRIGRRSSGSSNGLQDLVHLDVTSLQGRLLDALLKQFQTTAKRDEDDDQPLDD
jgi:hypothetical protein